MYEWNAIPWQAKRRVFQAAKAFTKPLVVECQAVHRLESSEEVLGAKCLTVESQDNQGKKKTAGGRR